jgi:hypothetical protein
MKQLKYENPNEAFWNDDISDWPEMENFYDDVIAALLHCKRSDVVMLNSLNPEDEEGCDISDFFPQGTKLQTLIRTEPIFTVSESGAECGMGVLTIFLANGLKFVATQNSSPYAVYTARNTAELFPMSAICQK